MATEIAVEFEREGRKLRVVLDQLGPVQAVIVGAASNGFINKFKVKRTPEFPEGVKVFDPSGKDVTKEMKTANFGPGVCYMIGFELFCW